MAAFTLTLRLTKNQTANQAEPLWTPDVEFFQQALGFRIGNYGLTNGATCILRGN